MKRTPKKLSFGVLFYHNGSFAGVPAFLGYFFGVGLSFLICTNTRSKSVSGSKREITASFSHTVRIPFWNLRWQQSKTLKSKVIRPVLFIEKVEKARNLIQAAKDSG